MPVKRISITITGRVQGVGYRYFAEDAANELGVYGWVRNSYDRTVECEAQAEESVLKEFVEKLRTDPALSKAKDVFTVELPSIETQDRQFEITG